MRHFKWMLPWPVVCIILSNVYCTHGYGSCTTGICGSSCEVYVEYCCDCYRKRQKKTMEKDFILVTLYMLSSVHLMNIVNYLTPKWCNRYIVTEDLIGVIHVDDWKLMSCFTPQVAYFHYLIRWIWHGCHLIRHNVDWSILMAG